MVPYFGMMTHALHFFKCRGILVSPKHPILGVNMAIQEDVGFIQKPDINPNSSSSLIFCKNYWHMATLFSASVWVSWCLICIWLG